MAFVIRFVPNPVSFFTLLSSIEFDSTSNRYVIFIDFGITAHFDVVEINDLVVSDSQNSQGRRSQIKI